MPQRAGTIMLAVVMMTATKTMFTEQPPPGPDLVVRKARRKTDKSITDTPLNLSLLFSDHDPPVFS